MAAQRFPIGFKPGAIISAYSPLRSEINPVLLMRKLAQEDFAWAKVEIIHKEAERMKEIVRKIGRITRYETKPYVGEARILDLERASDEETSPAPKG